YHGWSISNQWWFRDLTDFGTVPSGGNVIVYTSNRGNSLFPNNQGLFDYGMTLESGYFVIPKKLEVAGRWSWIRGQSGDINGNGVAVPSGIPGVVRIPGAFTHFHEADEYGITLNYFFKRHLWKWQTDFSVYQGGNPAAE